MKVRGWVRERERGDGLHAGPRRELLPPPSSPSRDAAAQLEGGDTLPLLEHHSLLTFER